SQSEDEDEDGDSFVLRLATKIVAQRERCRLFHSQIANGEDEDGGSGSFSKRRPDLIFDSQTDGDDGGGGRRQTRSDAVLVRRGGGAGAVLVSKQRQGAVLVLEQATLASRGASSNAGERNGSPDQFKDIFEL
ncbi:hypothetical protein U1Q18_045879, partial [Sarracenia purpurea var. burkii]